MLFLAELYVPRGGQFEEVTVRARAGAASAASEGLSVSFREAIFVPLDECCFVLYESESADGVRAAGALAGLEFDRVSAAQAVW
jgi:hypothetical protein